MKSLFTLTLFCLLFVSVAQAQWIISMTVTPPTPTVNDQVMVIAEVQFPSGGCDDKILQSSGSGNELFLSAMHCVGMAAYICNSTDTFLLGQLPAGNYLAHFQLDMGMGPSPCTPGIVPGPTDSIAFMVTTTTGLSQVDGKMIQLFPNPGKTGFEIHFNGTAETLVEICDLGGRVIHRVTGIHSGEYIDLHNLQAGTYLVGVYEEGKLVAREKWVMEM